ADLRSLTSVLVSLGKDLIHDTSGEDDFAIRDRRWAARSDAVVKALNELLHAEILIKLLPNKVGDVDACVPKMLAGSAKGREKIGQIAFAGLILAADNGSADVIDYD